MILPNMISEPQIPVVHDSFTFSSRFFFFWRFLGESQSGAKNKIAGVLGGKSHWNPDFRWLYLVDLVGGW